MSVQVEITAYTIMYSSNTFARRIGLKNNGKFIGQLNCKSHDINTLPIDTETKVNGNPFYNLYYYVEDFENLIGILKSKKQKFLYFNGSGGGAENGISID
jgi:hypothetical protein